MPRTSPPASPRWALLLALAACGQKAGSSNPYAFTSPTPLTHRGFDIAAGPHAVDCAACHGTFDSFKQFDCLGCHAQPPTAAVHATTGGYAYDSASCLDLPRRPELAPVRPQGRHACATCHDAGAFYAALPVAGFTHPATGGTDCSGCHAIATWRDVTAPSGWSPTRPPRWSSTRWSRATRAPRSPSSPPRSRRCPWGWTTPPPRSTWPAWPAAPATPTPAPAPTTRAGSTPRWPTWRSRPRPPAGTATPARSRPASSARPPPARRARRPRGR